MMQTAEEPPLSHEVKTSELLIGQSNSFRNPLLKQPAVASEHFSNSANPTIQNSDLHITTGHVG